MLDQPSHLAQRWSWCLLVVWTLLIYAAIPLARAIQYIVEVNLGRSFFGLMVYVAVGMGVLLALAQLVQARRRIRGRDALWIGGVGCLFALGTFHLRHAPEESLHFIEYGVLSLLAFLAFRHRVRDPLVYVAAFLLAALLGLTDEIIQWLTPRRFWEYRDAGINVFAAFLLQVALAGGLRPPYIRAPIQPASLRLVCRLGALLSALLLLCTFNTASAMHRYQSALPCLGYLDEIMTPMGYRISDPAFGAFRSRLSPSELIRQDAERGGEVGGILSRHRSDDYEAFLQKFNPVADPFLHEARVHLYRRDQYLKRALRVRRDPDRFRAALWVAVCENRILERWYQRTTERAEYPFLPEAEALLTQVGPPERAYGSPVGGHLFDARWVQASRALLTLLLLAALFLPGYAARRGWFAPQRGGRTA